jgi:hypothetical protein
MQAERVGFAILPREFVTASSTISISFVEATSWFVSMCTQFKPKCSSLCEKEHNN